MDKSESAAAIFNKLAEGYQEKFMNVDLYSDSLDLFCSNLKTDAEVLELACGPGNVTKYLLSKRTDIKILGIDLAPRMIELAKLNNPTAEFKVMDCRKINGIKKYFDGIMCGFALPYLSKEEAITLIADCSKLLSPKGVIYLSTMEDNYEASGFKKGSSGDEIYMHYHEAGYLTKALEESDFKVIDESRKGYSSADGTEVTDLILIAQK